MSEEIVERGYDKIAEKYHLARDRFSHEKELKEFIKFIPKNGKILDAGCGAGIPVAKTLSDSGFKVVGIDISEKMLELAKKHVPHATFIKMDMANVEFKNESFDGITAFYSLIHVPKEKHEKIFMDFYSILKKGGIALLCLGPEEWEATEGYMGTRMFWSQHSPEKSLDMIKKAGFEVIWDKTITRGGETHYWILARKERSETE